jgi:general nucleoside transport system ATP-binding protein
VTASVELRELRKQFGPVVALAGASLTAFPGEVHALLGENGAGKTTLLNLLDGMLAPDSGQIRIQGSNASPRSPREAVALGVGLVHQHFTLVPRFTVLENVALGLGSRGWGLGWPMSDVRERLLALAEETGLGVDPDAPVEGLEVSARQRVEILKVLLRDPAILALDEPTAVLVPREVERLFGILRGLAARGRTILLIAHKLDEVLAVADRVTVLRDGRTVLEALRSDVDGPTLARAMVGRPVSSPPPPSPPHPGEVVARLDGVRGAGGRGEEGLRGVSLELRRGEILGVAGVEGNGQRELALVLAGLRVPSAGSVELPPRVGFIPGDRRDEGLILDFDLAENLALALHRDPAWRRGPALRWPEIRREADELIRRYGIRAPGAGTPARALSGGNQQKMVVGRELDREPDLLVVENPTRGLDVGATEFVHGELRRRREGRAILLLSTDLDEVLALSDRIVVMVRGACVAVPPGERTREGVGERMLSGADPSGGER